MNIELQIKRENNDEEVSEIRRRISQTPGGIPSSDTTLPINIYSSRSKGGCVYIGQTDPDSAVLCIPTTIKLDQVNEYLTSMYNVGAKYQNYGYTTSSTFQEVTDFKKELHKYPAYIVDITNNMLVLNIDINESVLSSILSETASRIGLQNAKNIIKGLAKIKITDDRTYIARKEIHINEYGTAIY